MMAKRKIRVKLHGRDAHTAYIILPGHPEGIVPGCIARAVVLDDLLDYVGPRVHLGLDKDRRLIGIEILVSLNEVV